MSELKKCRAWHKPNAECWFTLAPPDCGNEPCLVEIDGDANDLHNCLINVRRIIRPETNNAPVIEQGSVKV